MSIRILKERDYMTPAMVYNRVSETLLVFASAKMSDRAQRELVMRRADIVQESFRNFSPRWYEIETMGEASFPEHSSTNPCPVFDEKNNKIFLFFVVTKITSYYEDGHFYNARLCYLTSDDFGRSWSGANHLTTSLPEHCVNLATGPGHGLQTEDGRLIVPIFAFIANNPAVDQPAPHAVALYSDDGGESWQFGSLLPEKSAASHMAEVWGDEGRFIYCIANKDWLLVEASSQDNGNTFVMSEDGKFAKTFSAAPGSLLSIPVQDTFSLRSDANQTNKWLILTQTRTAECDLGVYVNKTPSDPKGWTKPWIINRGPSGHSDMVYLDYGSIACIYETSKNEDMKDVAMKIFHFKNIEPDTEYDTDRCLCSCTIM